MKILQINTIVNSGSTGRIAEEIGLTALARGYNSYIAAGISNRPSKSQVLPIGSGLDRKWHGIITRLFDRHGFGSKKATKAFIRQIKNINPDLIHLHNIHGYYLNIEIFFNYLKSTKKPVIWTFHDCWPFTGHCSYFDAVNCFKWKTQCDNCPNRKGYPESWIIDNSKNNFIQKKELFNSVDNLTIVTPSNWLKKHVECSFLSSYSLKVIHNGIDLDSFSIIEGDAIRKKYNLANKKILLGVASIWDKRKGMTDFVSLANTIDNDYKVVLVGLTERQINKLPKSIIGISRTESVKELATLYSVAEVFLNPTYVDNFPTTNIEALACGTPVVTYDTGGSPEAIGDLTGCVVEKGNVNALWKAIQKLGKKDKEHYSKVCRERAEALYDKKDRYEDYIQLYEQILNNHKPNQSIIL